jgi:hypothetical protein
LQDDSEASNQIIDFHYNKEMVEIKQSLHNKIKYFFYLLLTLSSLDFGIMQNKCFIRKESSIMLFNIKDSPVVEDEPDFQFEHPLLSMKMDQKNNLIYLVDQGGNLQLISS